MQYFTDQYILKPNHNLQISNKHNLKGLGRRKGAGDCTRGKQKGLGWVRRDCACSPPHFILLGLFAGKSSSFVVVLQVSVASD